MSVSQQLELFPELASPIDAIDYGNVTYTLDTNGSVPYTLTYSIDDQMRQAVEFD